MAIHFGTKIGKQIQKYWHSQDIQEHESLKISDQVLQVRKANSTLSKGLLTAGKSINQISVLILLYNGLGTR